MSRHWSC